MFSKSKITDTANTLLNWRNKVLRSRPRAAIFVLIFVNFNPRVLSRKRRTRAQASHENITVLSLLKAVRANCFCASFLRTQIHTPRHTRARALSKKMNNNK